MTAVTPLLCIITMPRLTNAIDALGILKIMNMIKVLMHFNWFCAPSFIQRCKKIIINEKLQLGPGVWGWGVVV